MNRQYITIDGIRLAYEEYGEGKPMLFIHGIAACSYSWRRVAQSLASGYRCICIDLMGFGYSDKPRRESYTLKRQAEIILKAVDALKLDRPIIAGHSLGGGVCLALMYLLGERQNSVLSGLVLVDPACYPQKMPSFLRFMNIPVLPILTLKVFPERWGFLSLKWCMYQDEKQAEEAIAEYSDRLKSPGAHEALIATARNLIPDNIDEMVASYSNIALPTLIIWGGKDRIIPLQLGRRLSEQIPNAKLHIFDDRGHCPQEESPEKIAQVISIFAERIPNMKDWEQKQSIEGS